MEKKEIWNLVIALAIMTFVIGFSKFTITAFFYALTMSFILLFVFIASQKIVANKLGYDINFKLWTFRRYWLRPHDHLDWDFPAWIVFPLILTVLSDGLFKWTALLTFVTRKTARRAARKFSEIKEFDLSLIASSGIFAILVLSLIIKLIGLNDFASLASWFAFLNVLPLGNMNGTKIFFGSKILWTFLVVLTVIILILINLAHLVATIFIALILAALAAVIFYYFYER